MKSISAFFNWLSSRRWSRSPFTVPATTPAAARIPAMIGRPATWANRFNDSRETSSNPKPCTCSPTVGLPSPISSPSAPGWVRVFPVLPSGFSKFSMEGTVRPCTPLSSRRQTTTSQRHGTSPCKILRSHRERSAGSRVDQYDSPRGTSASVSSVSLAV